MNDGYIDTFVKDDHSTNNARAAAHIILIIKNVTRGLKSMFFEIKNRELCNDFPDEIDLHGISTDQLSIMRKNRDYTREYLKRRDNQSHPDMKVPTLTGINFEEFDLSFTAADRIKNTLTVIPLDNLFRTDLVGNYNLA